VLKITSAENGGKPLGGGRGSVPNSAGGAYSALQTPYLVGRGLAALFEVGVTALSPPETDRLLLRDQGSGTVCQMTLQLLHLCRCFDEN